MSTAPSAHGWSIAPPRPGLLLAAVAVVAGACATGAAIVAIGPFGAGVAASIPLAIYLTTRAGAVAGAIMAIVALTVVFGRDLAYVQAGPIYVLDLALICFLLLAFAQLPEVVRRTLGPCVLIGGLVLLTTIHLLRGPTTQVTLREAVVGFYSLWALVGLVLAYRGLATKVSRWILYGALGAIVVLALFLAGPDNVFTSRVTPRIIPSAGSLYVGFLILAVIFAPALAKARLVRALLVPAAIIALVEIGLGQVRSVWVALPAAVVGTIFLSRRIPGSGRRLVRFTAAGAAIVFVAAVVSPASVQTFETEFRTIYRYDVSSVSAANAQWRVDTIREAVERIAANPINGIGMEAPTAYVRHRGAAPKPEPLHNSFLALGLRLGVPGLLLIALFQISVITHARRFIRSAPEGFPRQLVAWLLACQLLTACHALFTVVLQGPYMGLFYWLFGGLVIGIARGGEIRQPDPEEEVAALPAPVLAQPRPA